jgi:23S rRNA pseudouridine1911/1915/1917 synthase
MGIKILYEDGDILAVDKPSGILVHHAPVLQNFSSCALPRIRGGTLGDKNFTEPALTDLFLKKYPKLEIVHRLDKGTSGVLLLAKNQKAHEFLKKQFSVPALGLKTKSRLVDRQNRIKKVYIAIVSGWVKNDHGIINKPIGRSPSDFRRRLAGRGARGELREAITEYKVLKRFEHPSSLKATSPSQGRKNAGSSPPVKGECPKGEGVNKFSLLEIKPKTGRTHQIRAHMKFLNHPIVCDLLYNPKGFCPKELNRLALHAKSIEFKNLKGETIKVESKIPKEFKKIIEKI